jgi:hypothetical protein
VAQGNQRLWLKWQSAVALQLHPSLWSSYMRSSFETLEDLGKETKDLRATEANSAAPPSTPRQQRVAQRTPISSSPTRMHNRLGMSNLVFADQYQAPSAFHQLASNIQVPQPQWGGIQPQAINTMGGIPQNMMPPPPPPPQPMFAVPQQQSGAIFTGQQPQQQQSGGMFTGQQPQEQQSGAMSTGQQPQEQQSGAMSTGQQPQEQQTVQQSQQSDIANISAISSVSSSAAVQQPSDLGNLSGMSVGGSLDFNVSQTLKMLDFIEGQDKQKPPPAPPLVQVEEPVQVEEVMTVEENSGDEKNRSLQMPTLQEVVTDEDDKECEEVTAKDKTDDERNRSLHTPTLPEVTAEDTTGDDNDKDNTGDNNNKDMDADAPPEVEHKESEGVTAKDNTGDDNDKDNVGDNNNNNQDMHEPTKL